MSWTNANQKRYTYTIEMYEDEHIMELLRSFTESHGVLWGGWISDKYGDEELPDEVYEREAEEFARAHPASWVKHVIEQYHLWMGGRI